MYLNERLLRKQQLFSILALFFLLYQRIHKDAFAEDWSPVFLFCLLPHQRQGTTR